MAWDVYRNRDLAAFGLEGEADWLVWKVCGERPAGTELGQPRHHVGPQLVDIVPLRDIQEHLAVQAQPERARDVVLLDGLAELLDRDKGSLDAEKRGHIDPVRRHCPPLSSK